MSEELVMPRLSDTMEEGTIGRWLVHEGDSFREGDVLAEIETDKATMEFQAYDAGTVLRILVGDGETAALGAPIAIVGEQGETVADEAGGNGRRGAGRAAEPRRAKAARRRSGPAARPSRGRQRLRRGGALRVSPIARRMADDAGIDLSPLAGQRRGPEGRIVKADVERADRSGAGAARRPHPPGRRPRAGPAAEAELRDLTPMLKAVARAHGGVQADRPPLLRRVRDRHDPCRCRCGRS